MNQPVVVKIEEVDLLLLAVVARGQHRVVIGAFVARGFAVDRLDVARSGGYCSPLGCPWTFLHPQLQLMPPMDRLSLQRFHPAFRKGEIHCRPTHQESLSLIKTKITNI